MSNPMGDRNLLVGILAWQKQFITGDALVAAMSAWTLAKSKGLAQILREQKALTENQHALLEETVHAHLSRHDNDAKAGLAALHSVDLVKQDLQNITDADVQAGLAIVSTAKPKVDPAVGEPILTELAIEASDQPGAQATGKPTPTRARGGGREPVKAAAPNLQTAIPAFALSA